MTIPFPVIISNFFIELRWNHHTGFNEGSRPNRKIKSSILTKILS